ERKRQDETEDGEILGGVEGAPAQPSCAREPSCAGKAERARDEFDRDDEGVGEVMQRRALHRAPSEGLVGAERIHRENMLDANKIGLVIENIIEADEQRQHADASAKENFRIAENHAAPPLTKASYTRAQESSRRRREAPIWPAAAPI